MPKLPSYRNHSTLTLNELRLIVNLRHLADFTDSSLNPSISVFKGLVYQVTSTKIKQN